MVLADPCRWRLEEPPLPPGGVVNGAIAWSVASAAAWPRNYSRPPVCSSLLNKTAKARTVGAVLKAAISSAPMSPQTSSYTRRVPSRTRPPPHVGGDANAHRQVRHDSPPRAYAYSYSPQPARCSNKRRTFVQDPDEAMQERIKRLRIASRCGPSHMARLACWRANAVACAPTQ